MTQSPQQDQHDPTTEAKDQEQEVDTHLHGPSVATLEATDGPLRSMSDGTLVDFSRPEGDGVGAVLATVRIVRGEAGTKIACPQVRQQGPAGTHP